jgi:SAM-dependent methyltransferase
VISRAGVRQPGEAPAHTGPISRCRVCGGRALDPVIDLGSQPLANALRRPGETSPEAVYPLAAVRCVACSLVQLTTTVPPPAMFTDYLYFSSTSASMVGSMRDLAARVAATRDLGPDDLVVEVASNDGYLLKHYAEQGIPVLGVDPAANVAAVAEASGIPTVVDYFGSEVAGRLAARGQRASVIHANNVIAHVPEINDFLGGLARLVRSDGLIVIETPHVVQLVDRVEFDTIYHEHVFYWSLSALTTALARWGLVVNDVEEIPAHGGSLRLFVAPVGVEGPRVVDMLAWERVRGVGGADFYRSLARRVERLREEVRDLLADLRAAGRRIAGYGAAAKGTVLLNHFDIRSDVIDVVVDANPHKHGLLIPGRGIPVAGPERLLRDRPDDVLLLAWNWRDEIVAQQRAYLDAGGRFIVPVPEVEFIQR